MQSAYPLADRVSLLGGQDDAGVRLSLGQILRVDSLKVGNVETEQHTSFDLGEFQLFSSLLSAIPTSRAVVASIPLARNPGTTARSMESASK